ncbi:DoxX family protein [Christiangramia fulva]|uniref:DoxX family protein n=1 Tax=Christiangramia fulva TaxID=2126553 RepID=A0A2R3ZB58_9FLAO|nr:DoxX family protein [Christiangramia fulva]AVR47523.1 DoxX family protein [Christiangramia fulva]
MNKIFKIDFSPSQVDGALLIIRVAVATLMLTHGIPKLQSLLAGGEIQFPGVMGLSPAFSLGLAVFAEFFCSILILLGLATRLAVIPPIITMLIAVFMIHLSDPFANQELGLLYLFLYLPLLILGSGRYSVDQMLRSVQRPVTTES